MLINTGNISRKVLSKVLRSFDKNFERLHLSVRNTHENSLVFKGNEIQTSKETDVEEHGIGIRNIIQTIEKYGGSYVIRPEEKEFYFSIVIPR